MLKMTGKKKAGLQRMPVLFICVCVLPTLILTLLFTVIPTLRALWMSLFDSTALGMNSTFIGIENYLYMFQDDKFLQALGNTFKLLAVVPVITIVLRLYWLLCFRRQNCGNGDFTVPCSTFLILFL